MLGRGQLPEAQHGERTDFSTPPPPHPLAPSPACLPRWKSQPCSPYVASGFPAPQPESDPSLGPLLRATRERDVVEMPRQHHLPQCDQSLQEQPDFPRLLGDRAEHSRCQSSSCGDSCLEFLIHCLLDARLKPRKSEGS